LPNASFYNSYSPTVSNSTETFEAGHYRHLELLDAKFRQALDEKTYPFDKQKLDILINPPFDIDHFSLVPDTADSSPSPDIDVPGWRITSFHVSSFVGAAATSFGDKTKPPGTFRRTSRILVEAVFTRPDKVDFIKIVLPLFIIFLISAATLVIATREPSGLELRVGALMLLVFAVLLNMQGADAIASSAGLSMLDNLHLLTLLWVLSVIGVTGVSFVWAKADTGDRATYGRIKRLDYRALLFGTLAYLGIATFLVINAAVGG
jgi:hypothetical protein